MKNKKCQNKKTPFKVKQDIYANMPPLELSPFSPFSQKIENLTIFNPASGIYIKNNLIKYNII